MKSTNRECWTRVRATLRLFLIIAAFAIIQSSQHKFSPPPTKLKNCRILFSEWNFGTTQREKQFIELKAYCFNTPGQISRVNMNRYKVAVIDPSGSIMVVCHADVTKDFKSRTSWFFVIGGSEVSSTDFGLSSCEIPSFYTENSLNYIPTGKNLPYALVLLYNQRVEQLKFVTLENQNERKNPKKMTTGEIKKLKSNIQDIYVFGSMTEFGNCELYQYLLNDNTQASVIVRDWQTTHDIEDLSVNRCSDSSDPYERAKLAYTVPTPGDYNHCDGSFKFSIDDILPATTEPVPVKLDTLGQYQRCFKYHVDVNSDNQGITSRENFNMEQEFAKMETNENDFNVEAMEYESTFMDETVAPVNNTSRANFDVDPTKIHNDGSGAFIWNDCSNFPRSWKTALEDDPDTPINIKDVLNNETCFWYEYVNTTKKGRCKLCHALLEQKIIFEKKHKIPEIVSDGYMYRRGKNRKNINRKAIRNHKNSYLHKISLQYFSAYDSGKRGEELEKEMTRKGGDYRNHFEATENLMVAAYQSVRMGLTFYSFPMLMDMLKFFRVNTGHVHNDGVGMKKIIMFIESMIRKDIIDYLKKEQPEIGIMLDSSTDVSGSNALAVLFITFVHNRPVTFFYKLFPVDEGTSGAQLFRAFKHEIESDNLDNYFKDHLTSYVTDGCGTMTSTFYKELQNYVRTSFNQHWCYAHQLNLVSKNAFKDFPFLKAIDIKLNSLASFYGTIAVSRRRVLHDVTLKHGHRKFELKRMQDIRWIASKTRVMETFINRWRVIAEATEKISKDRSFDRETKNSAEQHFFTVTDGTFLATTAFMLDLCQLLAGVSENLQTRGGTLIGKRMLLDGLRSNLISMNDNFGEKLSVLLQNSVLLPAKISGIGPYENHGVSLFEFEERPVSIYGIVLNQKKQFPQNYTLISNYEAYIVAIVDRLDHYFDSGNPVLSFDFLDARVFWSELGDSDYGVNDLLALNTQYSWGYENNTLRSDWKKLLNGLKSDAQFPERHTDSPEDFWSHYLNLPDETIGWTEMTRSVIRRVMNIMASTAEVERIFSLYSAQKTRRRYNLKVETVNALVSIKFNSVSFLSRFPAFRYAQEFVKLYDRADDLWKKGKSVNITEDFPLPPYEMSMKI